ncbi:MAG: hypothetical protein ACK4J0_02625 [Candidatus Anstonellaceae archaeon]
MLVLKGKRDEIYKLINSASELENEIRLATKPSKKLFFYILQKFKNLEVIHISEGIFKTIPNKIINALSYAKIKIKLLKIPKGRPEKFSSTLKKQALELIKKKYKAKEIAKITSLPLTTIFMLKKKKKNKKD